MNIWIVNQYARMPWQDGGNRHFLIARELVRKGHRVTLIAAPVNYVTGTLDPRVKSGEEEIDGVRVVWLTTTAYRSRSLGRIWSMLLFAIKVLGAVRLRRLAPPDVVVGSSPHLFGALSAMLRARLMGRPFVFEVRDLWPLSLVELTGLSPGNPLVRLFGAVERACYRGASRVVTLLPNAEPYMTAHGAGVGRVRWIPNGIQPGPLRECRDSKPPFVVVYAGTHGLANALDAVVEAAAILARERPESEILFKLIGRGSEKPRLQRKAEELAPGRIQFVDAVAKQQVAEELACADACIAVLRDSPLYRHGISLNKLFDYMAAAKPVILSGRSPRNPVELSGGGIVVPPEDAAAIARAVAELYEMGSDERRRMGLAGREYVERNHTIEVLAERFERVLEEATGR